MNNRIKTLVILTPGFPENEADSTCIPPQQIFVKALKEVDPALNIVVLTFQYPFFSKTYQWYGIKVISFGTQISSRIYRIFVMLRVWITLMRLNKNHQVIGLLSFWLGKSAFIAEAFSKKYKLLHYCWLLGQDVKAGNRYFNRIKPRAASLIAISDFIAKELNKNYGVLPEHVIPVGVNETLFDPTGIKKDIDILGAGSLIPLKQYHIFLEVIKIIREYFPEIKAVICGDGPERERLRTMIKVTELESNVSLMGSLPHSEVLALMQRSKILLHPSEYEGFGIVCLEALCAGAKVVSFVRPMDGDIENWYITVNREDMVKILKDILQNPEVEYKPVTPYLVQDSARAIIKLFDQ